MGVGPGSDLLGILVSFTMTTAYTFVVASCYSSQASTDSTNRRNSEYAEIRQQLFVRSVADRLGGDAARGAGEYLEAMAYPHGWPAETHAEFARLAQSNFTRLFPDHDVDSEVVLHNIREMIAADPLLASSCRFAS